MTATCAHLQSNLYRPHPTHLVERLLEKEAPSALERKHHQAITIKVPVRFRRRGVEAKLVVLDQQYPASEPDANLVKAVARAHEWFGRILRCEANGVGDIARAERLDRSYVTRSLCLAFLAPEITKAILAGRQWTELTAKRLINSALKTPLLWSDQIAFVCRGLTPLEQHNSLHSFRARRMVLGPGRCLIVGCGARYRVGLQNHEGEPQGRS